jgi:uncharacterized membrane protein
MKIAVLSACMAVIIGTFLIIPAPEAGAAFNLFGSHKKVKDVDGTISIPVDAFDDGKAHYFQYQNDDGAVKFFVVKSADGQIRAAFDACDVCYPAQKGYSQDGDFMICNNCGRRFHSNRINVVEGGCNPAPLKRRVVADQLVIEVKDILPGSRYF